MLQNTGHYKGIMLRTRQICRPVITFYARGMSSPSKLNELRRKRVAKSIEFDKQALEEEEKRRKQQCKINSICGRALLVSEGARTDYEETGRGRRYFPEAVGNDCRC